LEFDVDVREWRPAMDLFYINPLSVLYLKYGVEGRHFLMPAFLLHSMVM
jgi:hypothetical protein